MLTSPDFKELLSLLVNACFRIFNYKKIFMKIIDKEITIQELQKMAQRMFGNMVKAVVDVKKEIMAVDAELHADEEAHLLENGSEQRDLWGINLYPEVSGADFIERSEERRVG